MRKFYALLFFCALLAACTQEDNSTQPDPGYKYFPLKTGAYVVYKVDSIFHDQPEANIPGIHDTTHYFVKEVIDSTYLDAQDENSYRVVRYKRATENDEWVLTDIWAAKRNANNAERVEENRRYVKMAFPIFSFSEWDSNALNDLDEWRTGYDSLYQEKIYGDLAFAKTVTVLERDFLTEVNDEYAYEVYAENVGLIFRHFKELFTRPSYLNNRSAANIISGNEYMWTIVDYGEE